MEPQQPAPFAGVLMDDATAEHVASALNEAEAVRAELENAKAKLANADALNQDLREQVALLRDLVRDQSKEIADVKTAIADLGKVLERSRKELEAVGQHGFWWHLGEVLKVIVPIVSLGFLLVR